MRNLSPLEIFLAQIVVYLILWLTNDYLASVISAILAGVLLVALLLALAVEVVERSKVPWKFFLIMALSILAPILVAFVFILIQGPPSWIGGGGM